MVYCERKSSSKRLPVLLRKICDCFEVWGSNLGPVKSDTVLPTARHCCDISSKGAVLPGHNDAEMGPANSLHATAYYSEYNERFDFDIVLSFCFTFSRLAARTLLQTAINDAIAADLKLFFLAAKWSFLWFSSSPASSGIRPVVLNLFITLALFRFENISMVPYRKFLRSSNELKKRSSRGIPRFFAIF